MNVPVPKPYKNSTCLLLGATGAAALLTAAFYLLAEWFVPDLTQHMPGFAFGLVVFGLVAKQAEVLLMIRDLRTPKQR